MSRKGNRAGSISLASRRLQELTRTRTLRSGEVYRIWENPTQSGTASYKRVLDNERVHLEGGEQFATVQPWMSELRRSMIFDTLIVEQRSPPESKPWYAELLQKLRSARYKDEQLVEEIGELADRYSNGGVKLTFEQEGVAVFTKQHIQDLNAGKPIRLKGENGEKLDPKAGRAISDALEEIIKWEKQDIEFKLQRNDHTRLHRLTECIEHGTSVQVTHEHRAKVRPDWTAIQPFVVKHDWVAAFGESLGQVLPEELKMPFVWTAFEFMISGKFVTVVVWDRDDLLVRIFVEASNGLWVDYDLEPEMPKPYRLAWKQVQAICVMLDSEIAVHETVAAPKALNDKRRKSGKRPISDYHVVDLSSRHRTTRHDPGTHNGTRKRAHWRRGHWMHADERPAVDVGRPAVAARWHQHNGRWRTWINWMIVGNPDLGFVHKEYKL